MSLTCLALCNLCTCLALLLSFAVRNLCISHLSGNRVAFSGWPKSPVSRHIPGEVFIASASKCAYSALITLLRLLTLVLHGLPPLRGKLCTVHLFYVIKYTATINLLGIETTAEY